MDYGLWFMDNGLWIMDHGSWIMDHGLWIMDQGLWIMDHGSWIMDAAHGGKFRSRLVSYGGMAGTAAMFLLNKKTCFLVQQEDMSPC